MKAKHLWWFLAFQVFSTAWAMFSFRMIPVPMYAALSAGGCFLLLGLTMLTVGWSWPEKWRSLSMYMAFIFTFLVSVPMIYVRLTRAGSFAEANIFGLNGQQFHRVSEIVFVMMMMATAWDLFSLSIRNKRQA